MRKTKQIVLSTLIALLIAASIIFLTISRQPPASQKVLAAASDIPSGSRISQQDLIWVDYPADLMNDQVATDLSMVVGQWANSDLYQNEVVLTNRIGHQSKGVQYPQPGPDRRLLTIRLKAEQANGFWLAAGNLIDLSLIPKNHSDKEEIIHMQQLAVTAVFKDQSSGHSKPSSINHDALICLDLTQEQALLIHTLIDQCHVRIAVLNEPDNA